MSSGWHIIHRMSSGRLSRNWYLIRMSYDNVVMSSGWHRLPFVSHPDEIANFDFPHHAMALQRFRNLDNLQNWLVQGHSLLIFLILALFWLSETGQIWGFRAFLGERMEHGGNGLKYGMLLYPAHLQNWLDYVYGLVIFLILVLFWLSETGQIWGFRAFSGKPIEEMAWNFVCWCIVTTFRTD